MHCARNWLWFAFKLYLWRIEKQLQPLFFLFLLCCDLLSNCIFDVLKNNNEKTRTNRRYVVICFQIVSLTYWKTTPAVRASTWQQLWFAFKLYLWRIEKQQDYLSAQNFYSCDLLSNCIFDVLKNNIVYCYPYHARVVICFQIVSLTYWKTTSQSESLHGIVLWFAFKLYLWRIEKQHCRRWRYLRESCDLLSNCIFDVLKNNEANGKYYDSDVVICFQIVSLTYWKTTSKPFHLLISELWFAFKLYLWRIEKQLCLKAKAFITGCDLLSNCIFDVLKNNILFCDYGNGYVVICFQIVSLTYWKTTFLSFLRITY